MRGSDDFFIMVGSIIGYYSFFFLYIFMYRGKKKCENVNRYLDTPHNKKIINIDRKGLTM